MRLVIVSDQGGPIEQLAESLDAIAQLDALASLKLDEADQVLDQRVDGLIEAVLAAIEDADA